MKATAEDVTVGTLARVSGMFFGKPLVVDAFRAEQIRDFLAARMAGEAKSAVDVIGVPAVDRSPSMLPDGIAVATIEGTLTPRSMPGVDAFSGLIGYDTIASQMAALAADASVRGVVLAIDSPGGSVAGVTRAGAAIASLAAAKPVFVVAENQMASGAYWLGSQGTKIFAAPDALVGSIGSLLVRRDSTAADASAGERWEFISNMGRKGDGNPHKAMSEDERAAILGIVSEADRMFIEAVTTSRKATARGRKLTPDAIDALNGASLMGRTAFDVGLVDELGDLDAAVAAMRAHLNTNTDSRRPMGGGARAQGGMQMEDGKETPPVVAAAEPAKVVPITADVQAQIDAAAAAAAAAAVLATQEVVALCTRFGCPTTRANEFLAAKKSPEEVFAVLQAELVAKDAATATSGTHVPGAEAAPKKLAPTEYEALRQAAVMEANARRVAPVIA